MTYPSNPTAPPKGEGLTPREAALMRAVRAALDQQDAKVEALQKEISDLRLALANQRGDMLAAMLSAARQPEGVRHDA